MIRRMFLKSFAAILPAFALANRKTEAEDVIVSVDRGDRGQVSDANGVEIKNCVEANLTTGRCVVFELNQNGEKFVRHGTSKTAELIVFHHAPMRFVPRDGGASTTTTWRTWESEC